jgi:hypothetical protein
MLRQVVPISISLQGDGVSTVFTFPVEYLFQSTSGSTLVMSPIGLVPASAFVTSVNPPANATIDALGNLVITLFAPLPDGEIDAFDVLLTFDSGTTSSDQFARSLVSRFAATTGLTLVANATGGLVPLLSITPEIGAGSVTFTFRDLDILSGGQICHFQLLLNATLTGANFQNVDPASSMTYDVSATSYTGGTLLDAGFIGADSRHNEYKFNFGFTGSPPASPIITLVFAPASRPQGAGTSCAFAGCSFAWDEEQS